MALSTLADPEAISRGSSSVLEASIGERLHGLRAHLLDAPAADVPNGPNQ